MKHGDNQEISLEQLRDAIFHLVTLARCYERREPGDVDPSALRTLRTVVGAALEHRGHLIRENIEAIAAREIKSLAERYTKFMEGELSREEWERQAADILNEVFRPVDPAPAEIEGIIRDINGRWVRECKGPRGAVARALGKFLHRAQRHMEKVEAGDIQRMFHPKVFGRFVQIYARSSHDVFGYFLFDVLNWPDDIEDRIALAHAYLVPPHAGGARQQAGTCAPRERGAGIAWRKSLRRSKSMGHAQHDQWSPTDGAHGSMMDWTPSGRVLRVIRTLGAPLPPEAIYERSEQTSRAARRRRDGKTSRKRRA